MSEHARPRARRTVPTPFFREPGNSLGDEALEFTRWFATSKYHLMGAFLGELMDTSPRDMKLLRKRYCQAVTQGLKVHRTRGVVTVLLALGVIAAAASSIAKLLGVSAGVGALDRAAAISASLSVVLIAARLLLDRYLERCDVAATFLAIEIATAAARQDAVSARA